MCTISPSSLSFSFHISQVLAAALEHHFIFSCLSPPLSFSLSHLLVERVAEMFSFSVAFVFSCCLVVMFVLASTASLILCMAVVAVKRNVSPSRRCGQGRKCSRRKRARNRRSSRIEFGCWCGKVRELWYRFLHASFIFNVFWWLSFPIFLSGLNN